MQTITLFLTIICFLFQSVCLASPSSFMPKKATLTTSFDQGILSFYQKEFEKITEANVFNVVSFEDDFTIREVIKNDKSLQLWMFDYDEKKVLSEKEKAYVVLVEWKIRQWYSLYQEQDFKVAWREMRTFIEVLIGKYDAHSLLPLREDLTHKDNIENFIFTLEFVKKEASSPLIYKEIGKLLVNFWKNTKWVEKTGSLAPWIANLYSSGTKSTEQFFECFSNTMWLLKGLPLEDRMISYLTIAINNAAHMNHFGMHIEKLKREEDQYLLADTSHMIAVVRYFLKDLEEYLSRNVKDPHFLDVLSYAARVVLNPIIHHPKFGIPLDHQTGVDFPDVSDFVLSEMGISSDEFVFSILNLFLKDVIAAKEKQRTSVVSFLKSSLKMTEEDWMKKGYYPPLRVKTRNLMKTTSEYILEQNDITNGIHPLFEFILLEKYKKVDSYSFKVELLERSETYQVSEREIVTRNKPSYFSYRLSQDQRKYLFMRFYRHSLGLEFDIPTEKILPRPSSEDDPWADILFEDHIRLIEDPFVTKVAGVLTDEELGWIKKLFSQMIDKEVLLSYQDDNRENVLFLFEDLVKRLFYLEGIILDKKEKKAYLYLPKGKMSFSDKGSRLRYAQALYSSLKYFKNEQGEAVKGNVINYDPAKKIKEFVEEEIVRIMFEEYLDQDKFNDSDELEIKMGLYYRDPLKVSQNVLLLFDLFHNEAFEPEDIHHKLFNQIMKKALKIHWYGEFSDFYLAPVIKRLIKKRSFPYKLEYSTENRLVITKVPFQSQSAFSKLETTLHQSA